jgi:hypothetical protein
MACLLWANFLSAIAKIARAARRGGHRASDAGRIPAMAMALRKAYSVAERRSARCLLQHHKLFPSDLDFQARNSCNSATTS